MYHVLKVLVKLVEWRTRTGPSFYLEFGKQALGLILMKEHFN